MPSPEKPLTKEPPKQEPTKQEPSKQERYDAHVLKVHEKHVTECQLLGVPWKGYRWTKEEREEGNMIVWGSKKRTYLMNS